MTIYNIHHTDNSKSAINVDETNIDQTATDLTLFGRRRLSYGKEMNQNVLGILEHFACPEDALNPGNPDLTIAINPSNSNGGNDTSPLTNPTDGQFWYNSTQERIFYWNDSGSVWIPIGMQDDVAANWGIIYNGEQIPHPVSSKTGYVFPYSECSWIVSPYQFPDQIDYMLCESDSNAIVTSLYSIDGDPSILPAFATYMIIGIKGNVNLGTLTPVPSATPTPAVTASSTPPVPTTTPTPTPPATPTFSGPLSAYFTANFPFDNPFYRGTVQPYYDNDRYHLKYPGITNTKYKILYTADGAPRNPWEELPPAGSNIYYLYIRNGPTSGTLGNFLQLPALYQQYIFCSGKSTEPGTFMVEGTDGLFYQITWANVTPLGPTLSPATIVQIKLNVTAISQSNILLYNCPPLQTSGLDLLKFNYDYVYATGYNYNSHSGDVVGDPQSLFYFTPPSGVGGTLDLNITGGTPPYTIQSFKYAGIPSNSSKAASVTSSGFTSSGTINVPITSFQGIDSSAIVPLFIGNVVPAGHPNVTTISNGYKVTDYIGVDFYYSTDFHSRYDVGSTHCWPEYFWHYSGAGSTCLVTGNATNIKYDTFAVVILDSAGQSLTLNQTYGISTQNVDREDIGQVMNFFPIVTGGPSNPGTPVGAGNYVYGIDWGWQDSNGVTRPYGSPAQVQYVFSLLSSTVGNVDPTGPGQYRYTVSGLPLLGPNTLNCVSVAGTQALLHSGCVIDDPNPDLSCPGTPSGSNVSGFNVGSYGSRLIPGTSKQIVTITKVWNNIAGVHPVGVVTLSSPIIITFEVPLAKPLPLNPSITNIFNWGSLKPDRTDVQDSSFDYTSPYVPYSMTLTVHIPASLNVSGSLIIPFWAGAYDIIKNGSCAYGTGGGKYSLQLNFAT